MGAPERCGRERLREELKELIEDVAYWALWYHDDKSPEEAAREALMERLDFALRRVGRALQGKEKELESGVVEIVRFARELAENEVERKAREWIQFLKRAMATALFEPDIEDSELINDLNFFEDVEDFWEKWREEVERRVERIVERLLNS